MHIGLSLTFQNVDGAQTDQQVWAEELALVDRAVELGFDGIWATEHHFTNYEVTPDALQFLTYVAGRHPGIALGTMAVILPWHDPVRVAEQISVLDNLSHGRLTLAIGRGLGKSEFEGLRIPMEQSRERFLEAAQLVLEALETGILKHDGPIFQQPERQLRPSPYASFRSRTYAAAMSPESFEILAELGVGTLLFANKSWADVASDLARYRDAYRAHNDGREAPAPIANTFAACAADADVAADRADRYMNNYYGALLKHYGFTRGAFTATKGYEHYDRISTSFAEHGTDPAIEEYIGAQIWGTPEQCIEKVVSMQGHVGADTLTLNFRYGSIPIDEALEGMTLFAREAMPTLQALPSAAERALDAASAR